MEIKANIEVDESELTSLILSTFKDNASDIVDAADDRLDSYIESWFDSNFNLRDELRNIDIEDYIDLPDSRIDEDDVVDKLDSYRPGNGCSLGNAFTEAVMKAFKFAAHDSEYKDEVKQTIIWIVKDSMNQIIRDEFESQLKVIINEKLASWNIQEVIRSQISENFIHNRVKDFIRNAFTV